MTLPKFAARRRGFTLIELLIVIVVIAILALIVIPKLMSAGRKAKDSTLKANLQTIRTAVEMCHADTGLYPTLLEDLTTTDGGDNSGDYPPTTFKGPYLSAQSGSISTTLLLPANPYQTGSTEADHWDYTPGTGKVIPTLTGMPANDANSEPYTKY